MAAPMIRRLEVFCALVEEGSATAAAHRLGMSQPGVSQQVSRLESELSLTLFARENGRMRPTETALALYEEATHAFDGLERVLNLARDIRGMARGVLRIAAPHTMGATFLPRALKRLTADNPQLRIQVHLGTYERIVSLVAAREADLGIAKAPVMSPALDSIEICNSQMAAVLACTHPLAAKAQITVADLEQEPIIMLGRGRPWRDEIDVAFRSKGVAARVMVETQSVESACGFAAEGFGIAIVPAWLTQAVQPGSFVVRPFGIDVTHQFLVVHPKRARRSAIASDLALALAQFQQNTG